MSGIDFNSLPQNLQQIIRPYMNGGKTVEGAIEAARQSGAWTADNDKQLNALNGGKAWGQFDGFSRTTQPAGDYLAEASAKDPLNAFKNAGKRALIDEFMRDPAQFCKTKMQQLAESRVKPAKEYSQAEQTAGNVAKMAFVPFALLGACADREPEVELNTTNNTTITVKSAPIIQPPTSDTTIQELKEMLLTLMTAMLEYQKIIAENTFKTDADLKLVQGQLDTVISQLKNITGIVVANSETLKEVKELMEKNNADNAKILEAVISVKEGVDKLGEDNEEIKELLKAIKINLDNLPENLRAKFEGHLQNILCAIGDNTDKLTALIALANAINENVKTGNKERLDATDKILAALEQNKYAMTDSAAKILEAIKEHGAAMVDGFAKLILIGEQTKGVVDEILETLKNLPGSAVNLQAVIDAINSKGGAINSTLSLILSILEGMNSKMDGLDATAQAGFNAVIKAIAEKGCSEADLKKLLAKLDEILAAIKDHKVKIVIESDGKIVYDGSGANEGTREDFEWLLGTQD